MLERLSALGKQRRAQQRRKVPAALRNSALLESTSHATTTSAPAGILEWSRTVRLPQARFMLGSETNQLDWFRRILFSNGPNYSLGEVTKRVPYHLQRYDKFIQGNHGHRGEYG